MPIDCVVMILLLVYCLCLHWKEFRCGGWLLNAQLCNNQSTFFALDLLLILERFYKHICFVQFTMMISHFSFYFFFSCRTPRSPGMALTPRSPHTPIFLFGNNGESFNSSWNDYAVGTGGGAGRTRARNAGHPRWVVVGSTEAQTKGASIDLVTVKPN